MINFWDDRYSSEEYIYGKMPNQFFKEELDKLKPGNILLPAEGEGRNAVYAAKLGWDVVAFDNSASGKKKAYKLAEDNNLYVEYLLSSFEEFEFEKDYFNCIGLIYAHISSSTRKKYHLKFLSYLKPGGFLILEGFSKNQINYNTGGPKKIDMLFSKKELKSDFCNLTQISVIEKDIKLNEGKHHNGKASFIRLIGVK